MRLLGAPGMPTVWPAVHSKQRLGSRKWVCLPANAKPHGRETPDSAFDFRCLLGNHIAPHESNPEGTGISGETFRRTSLPVVGHPVLRIYDLDFSPAVTRAASSESWEAIRMPTVLCIDDNAEALKIRKRMLEIEGYSVLT